MSKALIALIRAKPVTAGDLDAAALFALDAVASALAGRNSVPGRKLLAWARAAAAGGAIERLDRARQAFLFGALCHILEVDDLHRASVVHPGCVVVPVIFTLGAGAEGERALAMLHGYEASCRIGNAVGPAHYRIWHNTATCGPFGSAMAVSSLLELDDEQCVDALGNAGTQSAGFWQFLETGAMSKHLHAGRAAEAGLVAADLAALGVTGPPAILEGDKGFFRATCPDADPAAVLHSHEAPWQLCLTSIKPWPCCARHTHPVVEAALELHGRLRAQGLQIDARGAIAVETYPAALDLCDRREVESDYAAKFSLQHCVASHPGRRQRGLPVVRARRAAAPQRSAPPRRSPRGRSLPAPPIRSIRALSGLDRPARRSAHDRGGKRCERRSGSAARARGTDRQGAHAARPRRHRPAAGADRRRARHGPRRAGAFARPLRSSHERADCGVVIVMPAQARGCTRIARHAPICKGVAIDP